MSVDHPLASPSAIAAAVAPAPDASPQPSYQPFLESDSTASPYFTDDTQTSPPFRSIRLEQSAEEKSQGVMWIDCKYMMTSVSWRTKQEEFDSIVASGIDYDSDSYIQSMRKLRAQIAYMQSPAHYDLVFGVLGYTHSEFLNWAKDVSRIRIDVNQSRQPQLHIYMQVRMQKIIQEYYEDVEAEINKKKTDKK